MSNGSRVAELVKGVGKTGVTSWRCDRSRGKDGHEVVNGVDVTYYIVRAFGSELRAVQVGDGNFFGEDAPIAGEPGDGFTTMRDLRAALVVAHAKPAKP